MTIGTFLWIGFSAFVATASATLLMECVRTIMLKRRIKHMEKYLECLRTCDMMMQDIQSSVDALKRQTGIR